MYFLFCFFVLTDALFRLTHNVGSLGVATQALLLLHQLMSSRNSISDRFYRALYAVLASPELTRSTKAPMFLALLFKALKQDVSPRRVAAFAKRLLQVASEAPANFACGCLMLTSELLKTRPGLWNAVLQGEEKESDAVEKFKDADEEQEKQDDETENNKIKKKNSTTEHQEEDEEEDFEVVPLTDPPPPSSAKLKAGVSNRNAAWPVPGNYDMRKREPQYANAERSCFWELLPLASHAHPSVAAMARTILAGAHVSYDGDPLQDLTLHAFLDKFIQKKVKVAPRGDSLMQPIRIGSGSSNYGIDTVGGIVPLGGAAGAAAVGAAFSALDSRDVAPDDAFFYRFYSLQAAHGGTCAKKKKKKTKGGGGDDDEDLVSDDDDDEDAMDDFLAGEEDGGDEGIGADPDGTFTSEFEYSELEAAMKEESDVSGEESESEDVGDGNSDFSEEDKDKEEEGMSKGDDDDDDESLDGAEFSDISEDSTDMDTGSEEDDDDDESADAEITALMEKMKKMKKNVVKESTKKRKKEGIDTLEEEEEDSDDEIPEDINPFDLAEATDSEAEEEEEEVDLEDEEEHAGGDNRDGVGSSDEDEDSEDDDDDLMLDEDFGSESDLDSEEEILLNPSSSGAGAGAPRRKKDKPVFASADDFDDLIVRDLDGKVDEEEAKKVKADAGYTRKMSGGRGRGRGGGRGRGEGSARRGRDSVDPGTAKRQRK
jgi:ribosome biogenesis protein MAK21